MRPCLPHPFLLDLSGWGPTDRPQQPGQCGHQLHEERPPGIYQVRKRPAWLCKFICYRNPITDLTYSNKLLLYSVYRTNFPGVVIVEESCVYILNQDRNQCSGSMTFWCGSGSADPYLWLYNGYASGRPKTCRSRFGSGTLIGTLSLTFFKHATMSTGPDSLGWWQRWR